MQKIFEDVEETTLIEAIVDRLDDDGLRILDEMSDEEVENLVAETDFNKWGKELAWQKAVSDQPTGTLHKYASLKSRKPIAKKMKKAARKFLGMRAASGKGKAGEKMVFGQWRKVA